MRLQSTNGAMPPILRAMMSTRGVTIGDLRALSPLPENSQKEIDDAVVRVGLERLVIAADVMAEGLVYPLSDPLSVMEVQWESISKAGSAQRTMVPNARGENQIQDRTIHKVPVYLTTDDFSIGIRTLRMSQRVGSPIDVSLVTEATRRVNEAIEDAMINGPGSVIAGDTVYGLLNAPNANAFTYEATGGAWDNTAKTGAQIIDDILGMVDMLQAARKFGPYNLYIPTTYGNKLNEDYSSLKGTDTILQRILAIDVGGRPLRVRVADALPADRVLMVQMTSDVVDIIDGQAPTLISWTDGPGFILNWMVMAIQIPRVRSDYDGNSGIVVGNHA